jgi:hypothetical protein
MPPQRYTREKDLIADALEELLFQGIPAWRNNSGVMFVKGDAGKDRMIRMGKTGSSDILGCLPPHGKMLAAEAKIGNRRATPEQQQFIDAINKAGGVGFVFRTIEELNRKIKEMNK